MVYITGDTHARFSRLMPNCFEAAKQMTKDDTVIVCGDFGLWLPDKEDKKRLDSVEKLPFTTVWVDGNHEDFDRLKSGEFETVDFHGAKADRIRDHVFHIRRGEIMELEGKSFWCFGGASSHDVQDGILDPRKYSRDELSELIEYLNAMRARYRILGYSWWPEELPSQKEMDHGIETLQNYGGKVDYIVTHCAPFFVQKLLGFEGTDRLVEYFSEISAQFEFKRWFFGHYHDDKSFDRFRLLYYNMERII